MYILAWLAGRIIATVQMRHAPAKSVCGSSQTGVVYIFSSIMRTNLYLQTELGLKHEVATNRRDQTANMNTRHDA